MMSPAKLPFITLKMKPNEYHQLMPTLLDYAKTKGLYDYVVGNQIVESQDILNMQNQSKISINCTILEAQMTEQEAAHAAMVLKRLNSNPLYAYHYKQPIHAVDPLRPTQLEVDRSRYTVLTTESPTKSSSISRARPWISSQSNPVQVDSSINELHRVRRHN